MLGFGKKRECQSVQGKGNRKSEKVLGTLQNQKKAGIAPLREEEWQKLKGRVEATSCKGLQAGLLISF